ncbi:cation channel sperm-associated protein 2 isoform X2 [Nematostella vectensis]|uniref:cation channel sperm-associated protein 2 isoform X2 n=1 Tax=Nematostella vectensis TaxID=45351 RepID=UPI00139028B6|nr:cation channel sperm-associated protein 2 isoform X2 [Nematostella vectensis]
MQRLSLEMNEEVPEDLSRRAEIFRSKLIEDFQLLDMLLDRGGTEVPKVYSNEIVDDAAMDDLLRENPQGLIKFQMYSKKDEQKFHDRRLNRVKNKNSIPLGPWAHTVVEDPKVQNFMMILIITNSVVLGIQSEVSQITDPSLDALKVTLNVFDFCALTIFVIEIIVKWIDGFWSFWNNGWNIFDFFVTIMSVVPEVIKFSSGQNTAEVAVIADNLRVFRILRSLKMVSRFAQLRIIVLTILKAFKSMAFIMILLMTFMYIFAVAGTVIFASAAKSNRTDLKYKTSFSTLGNALITLFQLFTLDHWYMILTEHVKVVNVVTAQIYIILWICIGAFIFRNIFAGIMVMNFQNIRDDFNKHVKEQTQVIEAEHMRQHLTEELDRQDKLHARTRRSSSADNELFVKEAVRPDMLPSLAELSDSDSHDEGVKGKREDALAELGSKLAKLREKPIAMATSDMNPFMCVRDDVKETSDDWNATVAANLNVLKTIPVETLWPRDSLFRYLQLMEAMQENITERQQILKIADEALVKLHDS